MPGRSQQDGLIRPVAREDHLASHARRPAGMPRPEPHTPGAASLYEERPVIAARRRAETTSGLTRETVGLRNTEVSMDGEHRDVILPALPRARVARRALLQGLAAALGAFAWRGSGAAARTDLIMCDAATTSGITGLVLIGPMCQVMRVDEPCPDQPFAATLIIRDSQGRELCAISSGEDGRFVVGLPPGSYELLPLTGPSGLPAAASQWVAVAPGQYTDVSVSYDSGIR